MKAIWLALALAASPAFAFRPGGIPVVDASVTGYGAAVLAESTGLVAFWPLYEASGTNADEVVSGYDATYSAGATLGRPSLVIDGEAMSASLLTGNTGAAVKAFQAELSVIGDTTGTLAFWMYINKSASTVLSGLYSIDDGSGADRFVVYSSGAPDVSVYTGAGTNVMSSGLSAKTAYWIVVRWNGTQLDIFANNASIYSNTTWVAPTGSTAANIQLGHLVIAGSNEPGYTGDRMQGVAYWNVAVSDAKLTAIWNASQ